MNSRQKSSNFARNRSERQLCRKASRPSLSVTGYKEKAFGQIASGVDKVSVCPGDFSWVLKSSYTVERGAATRPLTVTGTGTAAPERGYFSIYFPGRQMVQYFLEDRWSSSLRPLFERFLRSGTLPATRGRPNGAVP